MRQQLLLLHQLGKVLDGALDAQAERQQEQQCQHAPMVVKVTLLGSRRFVVTNSPSAPLILRLVIVLRPEACTVTFAGERHLRMLEPNLDLLTSFSFSLGVDLGSQGQAWIRHLVAITREPSDGQRQHGMRALRYWDKDG